MSDPSIAAVDQALNKNRALVRHHGMRRTLWVLTHDDLEICHAGATKRIAGPERRRTIKLLEERADVSDAISWMRAAEAEVLDFLSRNGAASTREIGDALPHLRLPMEMSPGKPYNAMGSTLSRIMLLLGFDGHIARVEPTGGWNNSQYRWSPMSQVTTGRLEGLPEDEARARLVRRWLWVFGPAPASDIQWWTGWPAGLTNKALQAAGADEVEVETAPGTSQTGWSLSNDDTPLTTKPWVALLPGLDPTTMGWKSRDWYLDPDYVPLLFDRNGNGGPTVWVDGEIVGGWAQSTAGEIRYRLLTDVPVDRVEQIDRAANRLKTVLGDRRFKVRFPAPIQKELLR